MGVFGTGLYSGDFAMDLRSTVRAVSRLPFDAERLAQIVRGTEAAAADNPQDSDHTTFWLVLGDQFQKRGLVSTSVRDRALKIIDQGTDLSRLATLGMREGDLRKRTVVLQELRERLIQPAVQKPRTTLKNPQPYLMDVGDVVAYPTWKGDSINPYMKKKTEEEPNDGWGVIVIVDRGRAFDYLAWYRPLTIASSFRERPSVDEVRGDLLWRQSRPGTCSPLHFKRIGFEKIGSLAIDARKLAVELADVSPGISAAINDITIANQLETAPRFRIEFLAEQWGDAKGRYRSMRGISRILCG